LYLLRHIDVLSGENHPILTMEATCSPETAILAVCFTGFLLGLLLDPEDGGDMFLLNPG
jgi:hypothetical protein